MYGPDDGNVLIYGKLIIQRTEIHGLSVLAQRRLWIYGLLKHEKVAVGKANVRISNVCRIARVIRRSNPCIIIIIYD